MDLENKLTSLPPAHWQMRQAIVFDWYDGPRSGICALANPEVEFRFALVGERHNPAGLDDRFFRVHEIPSGSVAQMLAILRPELGEPEHAVWVPMWKFSFDSERLKAETARRTIEGMARPTSVIVLSPDLENFRGCWTIDPHMPANTDYAALVGHIVPQAQ